MTTTCKHCRKEIYQSTKAGARWFHEATAWAICGGVDSPMTSRAEPAEPPTTPTGWIKFSERGPTEADLPLMVWDGEARSYWNSRLPNISIVDDLTHWRLLPKDLPVVVNEDEEAMHKAIATMGLTDVLAIGSFRIGWDKALAWERSRGRKP